jgi:hypothetical protein
MRITCETCFHLNVYVHRIVHSQTLHICDAIGVSHDTYGIITLHEVSDFNSVNCTFYRPLSAETGDN